MVYDLNNALKQIEMKIKPELLADSEKLVCVFTKKQAENETVNGIQIPVYDRIRMCRAEIHPKFMCGTFLIPHCIDKAKKKNCFSYMIHSGGVAFADDGSFVNNLVKKITGERSREKYTIGGFLYDFLEILIEDDLIHLEKTEERIYTLEDEVLRDESADFNQKMLRIRKEISACYNYYGQLCDIGAKLQENENGFFEENEIYLFRLFTEKVVRLREETGMLREYAMQIRELYQTQTDIRQNRVMKILTAVTTIFLPLSLIAGWYGMNFRNMPELTWEYGYYAVIAVSAGIILLCIWLFKKMKFW